jgi:hypothetical protein
MSESRPVLPALAAFLATLAFYWVILIATLWLPLKLLGHGLGTERVIGGLLMPAALLILAWSQQARGLALHAGLILAAFGGALLESNARRGLLSAHDAAVAAAHSQVRFMAYAFIGAALHAAYKNAAHAYHASSRRRT